MFIAAGADIIGPIFRKGIGCRCGVGFAWVKVRRECGVYDCAKDDRMIGVIIYLKDIRKGPADGDSADVLDRCRESCGWPGDGRVGTRTQVKIMDEVRPRHLGVRGPRTIGVAVGIKPYRVAIVTGERVITFAFGYVTALIVRDRCIA